MKARLCCSALALLGLMCASLAYADEAEGNGIESPAWLRDAHIQATLRIDYFRPSKEVNNTRNFYVGTASIKALPVISDTLDGKLEARTTELNVEHGGHTYNNVLEAYATLHFENADLRIGKQIVAWGRADGINPTDNLTPRDLTLWLPFEDDQRFGTKALKLDTYLNRELTLTTFVTPSFSPSRTPTPAGVSPIVTVLPTQTFSNTEVALKLNKTGGDLDWSVSYLHGFSLVPTIQFPAANSSVGGLELHYEKIDVLGADVARNFGHYGVRGEFAYFHPRDTPDVNFSAIKPYFFFVVGGDRTFSDSLNINLQFFGRRVEHFSTQGENMSPAQRKLSIQNAITQGQLDSVSRGISMRVNKKWLGDTLEGEVLAIVNLTRSNSFIRPLLTYAVNDRCKISVGAVLYNGAPLTLFGRLKANQRGFVEMRFSP